MTGLENYGKISHERALQFYRTGEIVKSLRHFCDYCVNGCSRCDENLTENTPPSGTAETVVAESTVSREAVNHPSHYNQGKIEVIDAIEDWCLDFNEGNVVKYLARSRHKGKRLEDLKKALWYLTRLIDNEISAKNGGGK
jgi:hypothetical protein